MKTLPDRSIDCVLTSPPYWQLRDYGVSGQLGLEPTMDEYIERLCAIFDDVKRVLKDDGTCWVNLGDSYASPNGIRNQGFNERWHGKHYTSNQQKECDQSKPDRPKAKLSPKCLCLIPFRFALAMLERDSMDWYEADRRFINRNIFVLSENDALQRSCEAESLLQAVRKKVESGASTPVSQTHEGMERPKQRQNTRCSSKVLLGASRKGNHQSAERERQKTQTSKAKGVAALRGKSSEVQLLQGISYVVFDNRPYRGEWERAPEGNTKIWLNFRVVEKREVPPWLQSTLHELQLGTRKVSSVSPSRRERIRIRKRDIPVELLRFFALVREERWCLRNTIIWHKPNAIPSSAKDRFTIDFEYVFFFTKNRRYYFQQQFEPHAAVTVKRVARFRRKKEAFDPKRHKHQGSGGLTPFQLLERISKAGLDPRGRNKRCVWRIATQGFRDAHFAPYPEALCVIPIAAGCPLGGVVLDPFSGAGTTGLVALKLGRQFIGIELNPTYVRMAERRIARYRKRSAKGPTNRSIAVERHSDVQGRNDCVANWGHS